MIMKIIAFGHRRRMGKDTCANFMMHSIRLDNREISCARTTFAEILKDEAHRLFDWAGLREGVYYDNHPNQKEEKLEIGLSPREIWIEFGEWVRSISKRTWPELMLARSPNVDLLLVSDLRHLVEMEYVHKSGGFAIQVIRPGVVESNDPVDSALANFDGWDGLIMNDGSLRDLNLKVKAAFKLIQADERRWRL